MNSTVENYFVKEILSTSPENYMESGLSSIVIWKGIAIAFQSCYSLLHLKVQHCLSLKGNLIFLDGRAYIAEVLFVDVFALVKNRYSSPLYAEFMKLKINDQNFDLKCFRFQTVINVLLIDIPVC